MVSASSLQLGFSESDFPVFIVYFGEGEAW